MKILTASDVPNCSLAPGDNIRRKDGSTFLNDSITAHVSSVPSNLGADYVRIEETGGHIHRDMVERVCVTGVPNFSQSVKADAGKLQWGLVMQGCNRALLGVVKVMNVAITPKDAGGRGYAKDSWKLVPDAVQRYKDALYRHLAAIEAGEIWDNGPLGTGQMHWDCIATNALFLSEFAHEAHDVPNNIPTA